MSAGLPEGFHLDPAPGGAGGLPPGFTLDTGQAAGGGELPRGFVVDQPPGGADLASAGGGFFTLRKDLPEGPTLSELVGGGYVGPDDLPEPAPELPPGIIERGGVYLRQGPQGALVPVGEKGLEQPLYSPEDLGADLLTGGLMGLAKGTGRSLLGHAVAPATKATAKELARLAGKEAVTSGAMGLLAGGAMEATDQATGSKAGALVAGLGLPTAATMLPTAVRHGLMRAARQAPQAAEKALEALPEGVGPAGRSQVLGGLGTLSENIGEEAFGALQRAEAQQALSANRIQAETGQYTLRPWVQDLLTKVPYLRDDKALAVGQRLRDLLGRVPVIGEDLAQGLGISPQRLQHLTSLAEVIPDQPLDAAGRLRLGIRDTVKDGEGKAKQVWRHDLDPLAARQEVATLSPVEQKFLMAYVEPLEGYHLPPRLPAAGEQAGGAVDLGAWSLERLAALKGMSTKELAASYSAFGHNAFVNGFGGAGPEAGQLAQRAARHLDQNLGRYIKPLVLQEGAGPQAGQGAWLGRSVAEGLGPVQAGEVGHLSEAVAQDINRLGFSTSASPVVVDPEKLAHIQKSHGGQLTAQDWSLLRNTIEEPHEVLPNLAADNSPGRAASVLLVRRQDKHHVAIVEATPGPDANQLWNYWKMSPAKAERYLAKFRQEKARRLQPGGTAPTPIFLPDGTPAGGKPEGLSGSQAAATGLDDSLKPSAAQVKEGPGQKVAAQAADRAKDLGNLAPDDSGPPPVLAAQVGRDALHWRPGQDLPGEIMLPYTPRGPFEKPSTISREAAFQDLVQAGVLQPGQKLSGYVTHMGASAQAQAAAAQAARLDQKAPELSLQPMVPGFAKERLDQLGAAPRLDEAVTAYRTLAETAKQQRGLLRQLAPLLLEPVEPQRKLMDGVWVVVPGNPSAKDLVRTRTEWSHWAGKEVTRQEPLSLVDIGPIEAEALGVRPGRFTIPKAFAERFDSLVGQVKSGKLDTPLTGVNELVRDLARYWKLNQLLAPGTAVTNLLGGLSQYGSKLGEDLVRFGLRAPGYTGRRLLDDLAAPVQALRPSMVERLPAEVLGGNVSTQFGRDASQFYKGVKDRLAAGEKVDLPSRALGALTNLTMKAVSLGLKPFGSIENYLKRTIYLSEVMDLARREAKALKAKGVEVKPLDLVARMFQERPDLHQQVMTVLDRFAYDYDNIPTWLKKFRESTLGAMTVPFPVYGYKYGRAILNQANALNPLNHGLPLKERLARGLGGLILPVAGWEAGRRYLAGGDSEAQEGLDRFQEQYGGTQDGQGSQVQVAYPYLDGREMIGQGLDQQGRPQEVFLRTAKYGYLNLPKAFHSWKDFLGFLDEFKTTGPAVPLAANLLELDPRQGPRDLPSQVGQIVAGLVPAHRMLEFTAQVSDDFRRRLPKGFWEQVMMTFPGGRDYINQPMDKWAAKLAQDDASLEWLKFLSGINLKVVDKADAKEALAEAVARAAEHQIKDSERLAVYSRLSGLPAADIAPHLPRIRQAETNAQINYRRIERTVFGAALLHGLDAMDPAQATAVGKIKDKVGREVVTHGLGLRNQTQANKGLRFAAGLAWINQNLPKGGEHGQ